MDNNINNKQVNRINVKDKNTNSNSNELLSVLNRIANALEERNMYENKLFKLDEKIKKLELKEAQQNLKTILEKNKQ